MIRKIWEQCKAQACTVIENVQKQATAAAKKVAQAAATYKAMAQARFMEASAKAQAKAAELSAKAKENLLIAKAVATIQLAMLKRRIDAAVLTVEQLIREKVILRVQNRYQAVRKMWCGNQHFTFWFIPADGQHIAKTHVKKTHLKYAFTAVASFLVAVVCTIGVLAHFAFQNEAQKQELAEYKQTKSAQEQQIKELQKMAEKNQKQLAYISKLEDQVRNQMEKNGAQLPPKSDASVYAGKGGASLGEANEFNVMFEQEKNIQRQASAKAADLQNLLDAIESENYRRDVTPSQWPTDGGYVSSSFGGRANPFSGYGRDWHPGIDIAVDYGTPVYASAAGYVQQAGWYGGYGKYIRLSHDFGYETAYGHMSRLAVNAGSFVKKGQVIGYVGSTGYSTGPHLHFEIIKNGEQVNPSTLM